MAGRCWLLAGLAVLWLSCRCLGAPALSPDDAAFFEKRIRPVLSEHCYRCHSAEAQKKGKLKGGLLLDTREGIRKGGNSGPAVVPGDTRRSLLLSSLRGSASVQMPPAGKLPGEVVADFERWVRKGAPDPRDGTMAGYGQKLTVAEAQRHWAFRPPQGQKVPAVKDATWARSDIDRFILAGLEGKGLKPVADAPPRVVVRRLWFDLVGLPPPPEAVEAFAEAVAREPAAALEKAVDGLLHAPQFGERWGRHWLDVVRYAEDSAHPENDAAWPHAWRYRNYVIDAFNRDTPFDQFVIEQLAGDLLPAADDPQRTRQIVATGLLALGPRLGNRLDLLDEQMDVVSRAFWGLSVGCARCHDHKFDPIERRDYLAMQGVFNSAEPVDKLPLPGYQKADEGPFQRYLTEVTRFRRELSAAQGRVKELLDRCQLAYDPLQPAADLLARLPERERKQAEGLLASLGKARERCTKYEQENRPADWPLLAVAVRDVGLVTLSALRVPPSTVPGPPRALFPDGPLVVEPGQSARLALAQWAGSVRQPLTARVMVNRVWQHLFGNGLVTSMDNFGVTGTNPTHPELLDALSVQFMQDGWSIKRLIQRIVLSRAYRLSSQAPSADCPQAAVDPDNVWLWRGNRRRLEAEALRDSLLSVSGRLDLNPPAGGLLLGVQARAFRDANGLLDHTPCRSVYLPVLRTGEGLWPIFACFDFAPPHFVSGRRETSNVPTQALYFLNNPFVLEQAASMADRLLAEPVPNDGQRLDRAFRLAFGRPPHGEERQRALAFVDDWKQAAAARGAATPERQAWAALCQALFASAEFRYVD